MRMPYVWHRSDRMATVEIEIIKSALLQLDGNVTAVSEALGIARSTLYKRLKAIDLSTQSQIQNWILTYGPVG